MLGYNIFIESSQITRVPIVLFHQCGACYRNYIFGGLLLQTIMLMQTVLNLKEALEKEVSDDTDMERCKDVLDCLAEFNMTLEILTETLIGAVVSTRN